MRSERHGRYCGSHHNEAWRMATTDRYGNPVLQCKVKGCVRRRTTQKDWCPFHIRREKEMGTVGPAQPQQIVPVLERRLVGGGGYISIYRPGHPYATGRGGKILEHRWVMAEHLGRALLDHENVHHINGDRTDNRLSNLELWSSSQPPGQRVQDKVAWALDLLRLYQPDALSVPGSPA